MPNNPERNTYTVILGRSGGNLCGPFMDTYMTSVEEESPTAAEDAARREIPDDEDERSEEDLARDFPTVAVIVGEHNDVQGLAHPPRVPQDYLSGVLELSTANLTEDTCSWIEAATPFPGLLFTREEGFMFAVIEPEVMGNSWDMLPHDLKTALEYAQSVGAHYVMFDRDNEPDLVLPTYEWA